MNELPAGQRVELAAVDEADDGDAEPPVSRAPLLVRRQLLQNHQGKFKKIFCTYPLKWCVKCSGIYIIQNAMVGEKNGRWGKK